MDATIGLSALQQAADYKAVRAGLRKVGIWEVVIGGIPSVIALLLAFAIREPLLLLLFAPSICILVLGIATLTRLGPKGFIWWATAFWSASLSFFLGGCLIVLGSCAGLLELLQSTEDDRRRLYIILFQLFLGVCFIIASIYLMLAGLTKVRLYRYFRGVSMQRPTPLVEQNLDEMSRRIQSASGKEDERVVLVLSEENYGQSAKALLEDDMMALVIGEDWHVLFASRDEVKFTPEKAPRSHRVCKGKLQLGRAELTILLEPLFLDRLAKWLRPGHLVAQ